jgi:hypothetical protein
MFVLKQANRKTKPYLMTVSFDSTGIKASFSEEDKAMRFVSSGAAVQVSHALFNAYGQFYPMELDR